MAAAFLLDSGTRGKRSAAEFMKEVEKDGIKFNVENTAEDLINGLFCTYEPPTSKMDQFKAAKAARKDPKKYSVRPTVSSSVLKWKIKKNTKKKQQPEAPTIPPTTPVTEARDDITVKTEAPSTNGEKKSVTWRDQKGTKDRTEIENKFAGFSSKYCGGVCDSGEAIADILSSPTGREVQTFFSTDPETPGSMASMATSVATSILKTPTSTVNSIKKVFYDDLGNPIREDDIREDGSVSYFPPTPASTAAPTPMASSTNDVPEGNSNLFCSNIPFMDTMVEGIGIAGVMAASAAVAAGVPETICSPYKKRTSRNPTTTESKNYTVPSGMSDESDVWDQLKEAKESLGIYEPESYDQTAPAIKLSRQSTPRHVRGREIKTEDKRETAIKRRPQTPSNRSYATSEITMGNTTIKHFSGNTSLYDDTVREPTPKAKFSSMVEELKQVQLEKALEGSSEHDDSSTTSEEQGTSGQSVYSLKKGYLKSPKNSVVTSSYLQSIKSPSGSTKVAALAKKFERGVDPIESRHFDGKMSFLPPTPRRKSPATPTDDSKVKGEKLNGFGWNNRCNNPTPRSNKTDDEIRESASSVLDFHADPSSKAAQSGLRPVGRRPTTSLVKVPVRVKNDDNDAVKKNSDPPEERQDTQKETKKKPKKGKKNKSFFKKALNLTKKVESQRIAKNKN